MLLYKLPQEILIKFTFQIINLVCRIIPPAEQCLSVILTRHRYQLVMYKDKTIIFQRSNQDVITQVQFTNILWIFLSILSYNHHCSPCGLHVACKELIANLPSRIQWNNAIRILWLALFLRLFEEQYINSFQVSIKCHFFIRS